MNRPNTETVRLQNGLAVRLVEWADGKVDVLIDGEMDRTHRTMKEARNYLSRREIVAASQASGTLGSRFGSLDGGNLSRGQLDGYWSSAPTRSCRGRR